MAVDIELLPANSINNIDTNFERVETALQDVVGRSGDTPNQMNADLDMNNNDLLNVTRIDASEYYMDGGPLVSNPNFEAVLAIADEIQVVADVADDVVIVADNIADILAAEGYATAAAASAIEADGYADGAGISAAAASVSETNAGISETNAEASAIAAEGFAQDAEDAAIGLTLSAVPVGMVFFSPKGIVPAGYLALEGASFDETVYTELYAYLGTNVLPDYTDRVLRHAGPLAGAVFTTQEDAMQRLTGEISGPQDNLVGTGAFTGTGAVAGVRPANGTSSQQSVLFDSGNSPGARVSDDETRVKAAIGKFVIKAYAALVDGGTADLVAIEAAQQYMVRFDAQTLSDAQKAQVRINIGSHLETIYDVDLAGLAEVVWPDLDLFDNLEFDVEYYGGGIAAVRLSDDNGSSWVSGASNYAGGISYANNANAWTQSATGDTEWLMAVSVVGSNGHRITGQLVNLSRPMASMIRTHGVYNTSTQVGRYEMSGYALSLGSTAIHNAAKFYLQSGTFTAGRAILKGIRK